MSSGARRVSRILSISMHNAPKDGFLSLGAVFYKKKGAIIMPNHISNILTIIGDDTDVKHFFNSVAGVTENGEQTLFDFSKVIPMPESLLIASSSTTDMCIEIFLTALNQRIAVFGLTEAGRKEYTSMINNINASRVIKPYNGYLTDMEVQEKIERILNFEKDGLTCLDDIYRLGMTALDNARKHGGKDWYDCYVKISITVVMDSS